MILRSPNQEIINMDNGYSNCGVLNLIWGPYSLIEAGLHHSALLKVKEDQIARSSLILHVLLSPHVSKTLFVYCYLLVNFGFTTLIFSEIYTHLAMSAFTYSYNLLVNFGLQSTISYLHYPQFALVLGLGFYLILIQGVYYANSGGTTMEAASRFIFL